MKETNDKIIVEWEDVDKFIEEACYYLRNDKFTGVYGLPRGGLIFAVMLSHKLNIPMLAAPCKGCLIVDDIADTGESLIHYNKPCYTIATMFYHRQSAVEPHFWQVLKTDRWVVYPWEGLYLEDSKET